LHQPSTSACVLDVLDQCAAGDEICLRAIGLLLLSQPELVGQIHSLAAAEQCLRQRLEDDRLKGTVEPPETLVWVLALAQLLHKTGRDQEADSFHQRAVDTISTCGLNTEQMSTLANEVDQMLRVAGHEDAANAVRRRLRVQIQMAATDDSELLSLRELAFEAFQGGSLADAERIYRHLLLRNFEIAGTHCHLARVLLTADRQAEAAEAVEIAWQNRTGAAPYEIVRIHFLRGLLATLAGQDAAGHLAALTEAIQNPGSHHPWLLTPVLVALRPRLTDESHAFFTRLADTVNDRAAG
jgi:hypothetical protein